MTESNKARYSRILVKLSGEALLGRSDYGIDPAILKRIAGELQEIVGLGVQLAVVIGGGNIFRGAGLARAGMDRVAGDHMGMLATVMNALAMHVAASNPRYLSQREVPADVMAKEREILSEQAKGEGKPPEIVAKMVEGRLRKSLGEITLLGQPFVKDPETTVEKLLKGAGAQVTAFERFEVGAGIEKKQEDFVAEVMAQVKGSSGPAQH